MRIGRRAMMTLAAAAAVPLWRPGMARGQEGPHIEVLYTDDPLGSQLPQLLAFGAGLAEAGLVSGRNLEISNWGLEGRFGFAREQAGYILLRRNLIFAAGQAAALAGLEESRGYPSRRVVVLECTDAVEAGLVESLDAPGGNLTGITANDTTPRLIELARAIGARKVGIVLNPANPLHLRHAAHVAAAAVETVRADAPTAARIPSAFAALKAAAVEAIVVPADEVLTRERTRVLAAADTSGVPVLYGAAGFAEAGGLAAVYADVKAMAKTAGAIAAEVLRGAHPRDVPMRTGPEVVAINLDVARAQGIALPAEWIAAAGVVVGSG